MQKLLKIETENYYESLYCVKKHIDIFVNLKNVNVVGSCDKEALFLYIDGTQIFFNDRDLFDLTKNRIVFKMQKLSKTKQPLL